MRMYLYADEKECTEIKNNAKKAGLSISRYLVNSALKGCRPIAAQTEISKEIFHLTEAGQACAAEQGKINCPLMEGVIRIFTRKYAPPACRQ